MLYRILRFLTWSISTAALEKIMNLIKIKIQISPIRIKQVILPPRINELIPLSKISLLTRQPKISYQTRQPKTPIKLDTTMMPETQDAGMRFTTKIFITSMLFSRV